MRKKAYYSARSGKSSVPTLDLDEFTKAFLSVYSQFKDQSYFQYGLGYDCTDAGRVEGLVGNDPDGYLLRKTGKRDLWPPRATERELTVRARVKKKEYSEDDLFDLIEFLFDCVGKPTDRSYHDWNNCGYHANAFDREAGVTEFRKELNEILQRYSPGYELAEDGEVRTLPKDGMTEGRGRDRRRANLKLRRRPSARWPSARATPSGCVLLSGSAVRYRRRRRADRPRLCDVEGCHRGAQ